jgi:uncharacterized protein with GYD domain
MVWALAKAAPHSYDEARMSVARMERSGMREHPITGPGLRCAPSGLRDPREDTQMATYIVLGNFTEQGIKNVMDTPKRAEAVKAMAKKAGVTMKEIYWTLGAYDIVSVFEADDDAAMTALGLSIGKLGNVRTQTLRAFSAAEMKGILGKVA